MGAIGKIGSFAAGEKFSYVVIVTCDVQGTALDPTARVSVKLV
jgi:hypothetical protein